jgi:hypothetical protein
MRVEVANSAVLMSDRQQRLWEPPPTALKIVSKSQDLSHVS